MMKEKKFNTDAIFSEIGDDIEENPAAEMQNDTNVDEWFEMSIYSPRTFKGNNITGIVADEYSAKVKYQLDDIVRPEEVRTLSICAASLKTLGYVVSEFQPEESSSQCNELLIYGHPDDLSDEFHSRLDTDLSRWFSVQNTFRYVRISGCFESIEDMQQTVRRLYDNLTDRKREAKVRIHMDSKVKDDEGRIRTIADLVHSGYIKPEIIPSGKNMIDYVYRKVPRSWTAKLFTKDLIINNNLFGDEKTDK